jgi:sigma-B regulation protein RsbU (phosphoserine phosphatase)
MATKILVVDDETDLEFLINARFKKAISEGEFEFYYALNGVEALKMLNAIPDLNIILTDINMPIMDGLTLLQNLSLLKRSYKAVVVSAYGDITNIRLAMNRGASDFIMKPINFEDFRATLYKMRDEYSRLSSSMVAEAHLNELKIELDIAKNIQESLLPANFNPLPGKNLDIAGKMTPAKQVGGDFFDFFPIDNHKLAIIIADVSGKNVSACLYMAITRSLVRAYSGESHSALEVIQKVDRYLSIDNNYCMFVTAFYAIWDLDTNRLSCCNAGHFKPFILDKNGVRQIPVSEGRPLGIDNEVASTNSPFEELEIQLELGNTIFLFTDGVSEAMNIQDEEFGMRRLKLKLDRIREKGCVEIISEIFTEVQLFTAGATQSDDITMLAVKYPKDMK